MEQDGVIAAPTAMTIALISDTHITARDSAYNANWRHVHRWLNALAPDLTVHLGDISANGIDDRHELIAARNAFDGLRGEMRFLPGNHDIGDNPLAHDLPAAEPLDAERLADFRDHYGADYWSLHAGAWQLIGLNAMLFGTGSAEERAQHEWLDERLRRHGGPLGLLLHKPLFRRDRNDRDVHERYLPVRARERLLDGLAARDLRFVVSGHTHQTRHRQVDGIDHVWAPSTAFCIPDAMQERIGEKRVGAMLLSLTADTHRFELIEPPGLVRHNVLDHPQVYPEVAPLRHRLGSRGDL